MLAWLPAWGQVSICYDFEDATPNSRPMGWGALPNLDYHYVGIDAYDNTAHTGSKALRNNGTTCFTIMPDEGINYGADSVWLTFWYYLHLNTDYFEVGYLTDATDSSTFHVLDTLHGWQQEWHFAAVDLTSVPTGSRIAFFGHDIFCNDGTFWLDDMHVTSTPCAAWGLRVAENRADSVRLEWQSVGDPLSITIAIYGYSCNPAGTSITLPRYRDVNYTATLSTTIPATSCMPAQPYSESTNFYAYREGPCLEDYVVYFNTSNATPWYGTPVEPYMYAGTYTTTAPGVSGIFAGSHALNTNPGSDGGGMMVFPQTIPPGDASSLRLGNRLGDWESASMLYTLDVDTNETDLLVMKYTVSMAFGSFQGPEEAHRSDTLHPAWFRIELLEDTLSPCHQFYIDAWDTAGWDEMNSMYKRRNFTGMAFDLSPYHGQRLHLRVTTTDGAVNNRWCYAYYNFECLKRDVYTDACTDGDSVTFTMPYGFLYRWYRDGETSTFSTDQSITVATDSAHYLCELTDRFNPSCGFIVSRWVLPRPQRWERDTVVENQLPYTWHGVTFTVAGDTTLILPSTTGCDTTLYLYLHVWPNQNVRLEHRVCPDGWPVNWQGHTFTRPDSVMFTITDSHGADSTVTLVAVEALTYDVSDTVVVCPGGTFIWGGTDYGGPTMFDTMLTSIDGCDSLVHVALVERDSNYSLRAFHSIDQQQWSDTVPVVICSNQTLYAIDSTENSTIWQWLSDSLSVSTTSQAEFVFDSIDSVLEQTITLITTSPGGCTDTLVWPVMVFPAPKADFIWTPAHPADISPEVQLINYSQPTNCQWLWLMQNAPESNECDSLATFESVYRWQGDNILGNFDVQLVASLTTQYDTITHTCTDTIHHTIEIVTAWLDFPNLVTPNGDGVNDTWEVVNLVDLGQYSMNELWIYDKFGTCVFHARNIRRHDQFWDPNHPHCPDGTYYYRFTAKSPHGLVRRNGVIEVIR